MGRTSVWVCALATSVALGALSIAPAAADEPAPATYTDVPTTHWASHAITEVALEKGWMAIPTPTFAPLTPLSRRLFAEALVKAFAPEEPVDPELTFPDLASEDPSFAFANVAVKLGWIRTVSGNFVPNGTVNKMIMDRGLVFALGLDEEVAGLAKMGTADGYIFPKPAGFAYLVLAQELKLNYNYDQGRDELDLYPAQVVPREYFANALAQAVERAGGWALSSLEKYRTITLPAMSSGRRAVVTHALKYVGYPYVYAAEWYRKVPGGFCCGTQEHGGFDCSGFQWWVMQRTSSGFPVKDIRGYSGYVIGQRRASLIAKEAPADRKIWGRRVSPGDLVFFDAAGDDTNYRNIDHGGVALGGPWFIHSSGSRGGVTIGSMAESDWWYGAYVMGRRLMG
jgi:cell wall-associated NlpC family hydrolase